MKRKIESVAVNAASSSSLAKQQQQQEEEEEQFKFTKRQLRSRLPRRRRLQISPLIILRSASKPSHFTSEVTEQVSGDSTSIASVSNHKLIKPPPQFRYDLRRIATRSYYRTETRKCDEVSESSCVESCSGGNNRELLKLKEKKIDVQGGVEVAKSEVSSAFVAGNDVVFEVDQISAEKLENSKGDVAAENRGACNLDLACSEQFSNGGGDLEEEEEDEVQNSSESFMYLLSDLENSCSEYTSSCWSYTSGSQFSEGDETHSPCFELFSQFKQLFCRSTFALPACAVDCSFPDINVSSTYRLCNLVIFCRAARSY